MSKITEPPSSNPIIPDQIPDKRYFTIREVSDMCAVKPHVLRYWEQEFPSLSPQKRRGNRRYYQREHVTLILKIRSLLYAQGYTIQGARQVLQKQSDKSLKVVQKPSIKNQQALREIQVELEEVLFILENTE